MVQVLRATFEAVYSAQERIRTHLDELIKNDRPITDEKERKIFMKELAYATLGLGSEIRITIDHDTGALIRADVETTARWLTYQNTKTVTVPYILNHKKTLEKPIPIKILWEVLRDHLFIVFPLALKHSASMSREQDGQKKTSGYQIKTEEKNP